jgi:hypothetical protein
VWFPGLKPWAEFSSPFGAKDLPEHCLSSRHSTPGYALKGLQAADARLNRYGGDEDKKTLAQSNIEPAHIPKAAFRARRETAIASQMKQADQAYDYQIDRHNKIEQARHDQNQNSGDQRDQGRQRNASDD